MSISHRLIPDLNSSSFPVRSSHYSEVSSDVTQDTNELASLPFESVRYMYFSQELIIPPRYSRASEEVPTKATAPMAVSQLIPEMDSSSSFPMPRSSYCCKMDPGNSKVEVASGQSKSVRWAYFSEEFTIPSRDSSADLPLSLELALRESINRRPRTSRRVSTAKCA
uniref:Uncharacterized protein n=1 Tax=Grammatophora oceanica TaxID=210454 RepID=A0A7S1VVP0_9STRA